jgi:hypothetical protein
MTALQALAILGALSIAAMLYGFTREGFWTWAGAWLWRPLWAFCRWMCRNPGRSPAPRHGPAAKAMRSAPITLSDEDVAGRWRDLEKRLADIPEQRNGGDR